MATATRKAAGATGVLKEVGTLGELQKAGVKVVTVDGRAIAVFHDQGKVYAVENRCPHMGFPLHRGTVRDGILTCHWHHAKFDLAGGCTFDPFADDVAAFTASISDGAVWVDPTPKQTDRRAYWLRRLDEGLEQSLSLVMAKAVIGLRDRKATTEILTRAGLFGVRNRAGGWSEGLSILTAVANVLPWLDESDRPVALFHGVSHVARATAGEPASFDLTALDTPLNDHERYVDWFRRFADVRASDGAERTLLTAVKIGMTPVQVADIVFAASTDHLFMDIGHSLDFANKAFELLSHIGWEHAPDVLPSIVPQITEAQRMEETASWRHPVALPDLIAEAVEGLDRRLKTAHKKRATWKGHGRLAEQIIDDEPASTFAELNRLIEQGVPLAELSCAVALASAMRLVHFRTTNEFGDWETVHHTFTYTNAVDQAMRRSPSPLLARAIFDGAAAVYLDRFLNVPKQALPRRSGGKPTRRDLLRTFDVHGEVDQAAQVVTDMLAGGDPAEVIRLLGHAALREDAGFHWYQEYDAAIRQYQNLKGRPEGDLVIVAMTRYLSSHAPTNRARGQTYDIAARLARGESLADE